MNSVKLISFLNILIISSIKKKYAVGIERFIAKMHLNQLYGRRLDLIKTIKVLNKDIPYYAATSIIKTIIRINDKISTLLLHYNINNDLIKDLNMQLDLKLANKFKLVKSNVAIAALMLEFTWIPLNF